MLLSKIYLQYFKPNAAIFYLGDAWKDCVIEPPLIVTQTFFVLRAPQSIRTTMVHTVFLFSQPKTMLNCGVLLHDIY